MDLHVEPTSITRRIAISNPMTNALRSSSVANPVAIFLGVSFLRCLFCDVLLGAGPSPITHNTVS